jgi:hypothetical protein
LTALPIDPIAQGTNYPLGTHMTDSNVHPFPPTDADQRNQALFDAVDRALAKDGTVAQLRALMAITHPGLTLDDLLRVVDDVAEDLEGEALHARNVADALRDKIDATGSNPPPDGHWPNSAA